MLPLLQWDTVRGELRRFPWSPERRGARIQRKLKKRMTRAGLLMVVRMKQMPISVSLSALMEDDTWP